ncbi:hypothetical protein EVAR_90309_1 [Eumeta japonica]|uniref:Uncharacterized protein n=1 Tax=Eumeta variegata TaxID=151549 RepID=A0A4C1ZPA9_EUMVA|nr:hypothetical protein EVAR_90309_1 [Eumeta japonica]
MQAPKRNRSARHEPVCMPISHSLALGRANCARVEGTRAFHFVCLSLSLLGGLTMPEWKGRVPLTRSHCERITFSLERSRWARRVRRRAAGPFTFTESGLRPADEPVDDYTAQLSWQRRYALALFIAECGITKRGHSLSACSPQG